MIAMSLRERLGRPSKWLKRIPRRVDRVIVVTMVGTGLLLPWAVALAIKLYLDSLGRPTVPWSDIAAYAIFFGPLGTPIAAAPLIFLAVKYGDWTIGELAWFTRATPLQGRLVVLSGFAGCVAGMVYAFIQVFWEFDAMVLWFIPEVVIGVLPWMAGGLAAGAVLAALTGWVVKVSHGTR